MTTTAPEAGRSGTWPHLVLAVVLGCVLGAGAGALAAMARPSSYRATVQEYIRFAGEGSAQDPAGQQKVRSFTGMVRSQRVLEPVIARLGLSTTVDLLATRVTATNPSGSLLVDITVTDQKANQAVTIADAIGRQFALSVRQLEGQSAVGQSAVGQGAVGQSATSESDPSGSAAQAVVPAVTVTVVGRSLPQRVPSSRLPWLLAGTLLGGLTVLGHRLVQRRRDPWIDEPADLLPLTGAAPLGVVEDPRGGRRGQGAVILAARSIAANLRFSDVDHPPRALMIAGPYLDGPQTSIAVDLAVGLARNGQRVVLVEADLADTRLRQYLQLDGRTGLTSILTGDLDLDQVLVDWRDGVQVLPGGPLPPNPAQVMRSEHFASLLRVLKVRFDYVLLDGPPILATPVAAELAARADGAVLVVSGGELRSSDVVASLAALERADARLLGTVFCDSAGREAPRRGRSLRRSEPDRELTGSRTPDGAGRGRQHASSSATRRSLQEFDDPSIVPLLLAPPDEPGRGAGALPEPWLADAATDRQDRPRRPDPAPALVTLPPDEPESGRGSQSGWPGGDRYGDGYPGNGHGGNGHAGRPVDPRGGQGSTGAAASHQPRQQTTVAEDRYPEVIASPAAAPVSVPTPAVPRPSMAPQPGTLPTLTPASLPVLQPIPVAPPPAVARPSLAPQPAGYPYPSTVAPSRPEVEQYRPEVEQFRPEVRPSAWPAPELRRDYQEQRPAYLDDPDLDRPYQPREVAAPDHRHELPRRTDQTPSTPPPTSVIPGQYAPAHYPGHYPAPPASVPAPPPAQSLAPEWDDQLAWPQRTVPTTARPGMTVVPANPVREGGQGRRRAREEQLEPILDTAPRSLPWADEEPDYPSRYSD